MMRTDLLLDMLFGSLVVLDCWSFDFVRLVSNFLAWIYSAAKDFATVLSLPLVSVQVI